MARSLTYNDVDFATYGLVVTDASGAQGLGAAVGSIDLSSGDGSVISSSRYQSRTIKVSAIVAAATHAAMLTAIDSVLLHLNLREDAELLFDAMNDRYWLARCVDHAVSYKPGSRIASLDLSFFCADPFGYAENESTDTTTLTTSTPGGGNSQTVTYTVGGSTTAYPVILLTANAGTTAIKIQNTVDNAEMAWAGILANGDKLRINCDPRVLLVDKMASGEDHYDADMSGVSGRFPALAPGTGEGVTIWGCTGTMLTTWRNRYL
ncbi:MAG: distal tail protein Dit [Patescibacteria group bacterium]